MVSEIVVITGASAGVGRATAHAFARRGAQIALIARGVDRLRAAAAEVERLGGVPLILPVDVADADAVEGAAAAVERHFGAIDIWINCAMATIFAPFAAVTAEEYRRATEVTYLGYVYGTMAALKGMRRRDRGTIVQVGSALAYRSIPLQSPYCGAKHAIRGFTDSLRSELIHERSRVHVTMVQMPALNTPQFDWARNKMKRRPQPVPPIFEPEIAADAIIHAAHVRRREIWVGASTVGAIIANRLVPRLLDRYLGKAGYEGQLTAKPARADAPDNLFAPLPGDHGTRGRFSRRARERCPELWASRHRGSLLAGGCGLAGLVAGLWLRRATISAR